jgi:hypothetical protein
MGVLPGRHARGGPRDVLISLYPPHHELRPLPEGAPRPIESLSDEDLAACLADLHRLLAADGLNLVSDPQTSASYRRQLARTLVRRGFDLALERSR